MSRATTFVTIAAVTALTVVVGYAAYFDYKRRNDASFRKRLRKEQKKAHRTATATKASEGAEGPSKEVLREALEKVKNEKVPDSPEEKEQYFMQNVSVGEQLCAQGETFYLPAALSFYRALRVYPSPVELIMIYQKTVPEPVFKIVMEMTSLDMQDRIEGYYDHFPRAEMNVSVTAATVKTGDNQTMKKNILTVTKDIKAGEVIYKEDPIIAALDRDLESTGSYCSHCLRRIDTEMPLRFPDDPLNTAYCSETCQTKASTESQNLLFGLDSPVPNLPAIPPISDVAKDDRREAQQRLVASLGSDKVTPLLVARFIGRQVTAETVKLGTGSVGSTSITASGGATSEEYSLYDHIERLRYLDLSTQHEEVQLISQVLETAMPGLEQFVNDERYTTLKGKMAYNVIGVCFDGGRSDKPPPTLRPEDLEKTRTPYGTDRQIGCGLYQVSSYLSHSCSPAVRPSFPEGTSTLHLIANHALTKGEELTMAYVDVTQGSHESVHECRLRRRKELARGWRFACTCQRCILEGQQGSSTGEKNAADESKVEDVVHRYDKNKQAPPPYGDI
ncbi:hypothetical protein JB92DRAFT_2877469 [Gautieria morchelliformis]|nr:hypothetical protein JB92DRAFT_2877469 [Gautieria morchelliformis]